MTVAEPPSNGAAGPPIAGAGSGLDALRRFRRENQREPEERCELCSAAIAPHPHHEHLLDPAARGITCACTACALLFPADAGKRFKRVPRRLWRLTDFALSDAQWEDLAIPVGMAVLGTVGDGTTVRAFYPSPAGATESLLSLEGWASIVDDNRVLGSLVPDVEAVLVHRVRDRRDYYLCPIDRCYELVGLIRLWWRGLSGGPAVRERIDAFFAELARRSTPRSARGA